MTESTVSVNSETSLAPEDEARARCYLLFAGLLHAPPDESFLGAVCALAGSRGTPLLDALGTLGRCGQAMTSTDIRHEYDSLFIGLADTGINPYESYYRTGFMYEKPLANVRRDFQHLGLRGTRATGDPEDHAAAILEVMAGLITGSHQKPATLEDQKIFFADHIESWIPELFGDLVAHPEARFYRHLGAAGVCFVATERQGLEQVTTTDPGTAN